MGGGPMCVLVLFLATSILTSLLYALKNRALSILHHTVPFPHAFIHFAAIIIRIAWNLARLRLSSGSRVTASGTSKRKRQSDAVLRLAGRLWG